MSGVVQDRTRKPRRVFRTEHFIAHEYNKSLVERGVEVFGKPTEPEGREYARRKNGIDNPEDVSSADGEISKCSNAGFPMGRAGHRGSPVSIELTKGK